MKLFYYAKKILTKPPRVVLKRIAGEVSSQADRLFAPIRAGSLSGSKLCTRLGVSNVDEAWDILARNNYPVALPGDGKCAYQFLDRAEEETIFAAAGKAMNGEVDILGSGKIALGNEIQWNKDYKTNISWANRYIKSIDYNNPDRSSDVKMAWELSRLQWMIPVGQAYLLTSDERYAIFTQSIITHWIENNPYAFSVNWACTMEPAMRIFVLTWFFHVFANSKSWEDHDFRFVFLKNLYLHADFVYRHFEMSDVNGNHCTADAAALVFAGLFFSDRGEAQKWHSYGWKVLCHELPRQVGGDGVDFEASIPYHRLVTELFFFAALYRERSGLDVPREYKLRIVKMGQFAKSYMRDNDTSPLLGDADDARTLPFGSQKIGSHHYLYEWIGLQWDFGLLTNSLKGLSELVWLVDKDLLDADRGGPAADNNSITSLAFEESGYFVMRDQNNHVFIDCAPVGLNGRGGHGHNDCLSFELCLQGINLVTDSGAYAYTASYKDRDLFRSTAYHNTPQIDGCEINRYIGPEYIWNLKYDAIPKIHRWEAGSLSDVFVGSHSGFEKLGDGITPIRKIELLHRENCCIVTDTIKGTGCHQLDIPVHLGLGVSILTVSPEFVVVEKEDKQFLISWADDSDDDWALTVENGRCSERYGVFETRPVLRFCKHGDLPARLSLKFQ